jgi:hypothetical protein
MFKRYITMQNIRNLISSAINKANTLADSSRVTRRKRSRGARTENQLGPVDPRLTAPRSMRWQFNPSRDTSAGLVGPTIAGAATPVTAMLSDLATQSPAFASNFGQRALTRANMQVFLNSAAALAEHYARIADIENQRRQEALRRYIQSVNDALNGLSAAVNDYASLA